ncbi:hypothetical protein [Streptomyces sparsus]
MTARAYTRSPSTRASSQTSTRLRWWTLALPVLAFLVLLALLTGGGEAQASETAAVPAEELLHQLRQALGG